MIPWRRILTISIVSIVTLLIWLVAESRTRSSETFPGRVEFVVAAGDGSANFSVTPSAIPVTVQVAGPASSIRNARELLRRESLPVEIPAEHGPREVTGLTAAINALPAIRELGVSVTTVDPEYQVLNIEERVPHTATVRPVMPAESRVEDLSVDPKNVTIYVLRPDLRSLPEAPVVEAVVDPDDLTSLEPGKVHSVNATLRLAGDSALSTSASIAPPSAQVHFKLLGALRQMTVDSVRVVVVTAPEDVGDFVVTVGNPRLQDVQVEAVPETINLIESGERFVFAVVYLTRDDMEKRIESKQAATLLAVKGDSTGQPVQIVGPLPTIDLTIEPAPRDE